MVAFISEWVVTIISVIIFTTFIEILIPNSNYKRYIDVVMGFLLVVVILTPLTKFIGGQVDFEEGILKASNQLELSTAQNRMSSVQYDNDEAVIRLYKNEIGKQLQDYIEQNTEYAVNNVAIEIDDNNSSPEFGSIKNFDIILEEKTENVKPINKTVKPIQINIPVRKNNNNTVEVGSILVNNETDLIKENIGNLYNISKDNINIHILKNN
ncbi:MAG: stage III sporulation protein AF [Alkaliphilus sp.]|nr:stage III sporulation protein AF [Alkaliphilus sp.]